MMITDEIKERIEGYIIDAIDEDIDMESTAYKAGRSQAANEDKSKQNSILGKFVRVKDNASGKLTHHYINTSCIHEAYISEHSCCNKDKPYTEWHLVIVHGAKSIIQLVSIHSDEPSAIQSLYELLTYLPTG